MRDIPKNVYEEVRAEYEASLKIPRNKPKKQFFVLPVGLVGAGKTTVMKPLAEKLSLLRISGDEIRKILWDMTVYGKSEKTSLKNMQKKDIVLPTTLTVQTQKQLN